MPPKGYDIKKAAHVAAFFLIKEGKPMPTQKLAFLIYLAEREFLDRHDSPILYEEFLSIWSHEKCCEVVDEANKIFNL